MPLTSLSAQACDQREVKRIG